MDDMIGIAMIVEHEHRLEHSPPAEGVPKIGIQPNTSCEKGLDV